jgi:hypothetical protein
MILLIPSTNILPELLIAFRNIKENGPHDKSEPMSYMTYLTNAFESPFQSIKVTKTMSKEIGRIILSLKASQTHGYDEISNNILKVC